MNWLIIVSVLAVASLSVAYSHSQQNARHRQSQISTGSCVSIGYNTACCPPGENCTASDGNCRCDARCRNFGNCCDDHACLEFPTTCEEYGIKGCCDSSVTDCEAFLYNHDGDGGTLCLCDRSTCIDGMENPCCSDSAARCPISCMEAGFEGNNCLWENESDRRCYIQGGDCYCDNCCKNHKDCCPDVDVNAQNPSDYQSEINRMLLNLTPGQEKESMEYEELLKSLAQDAETLNEFIQYVYALDARVKRARSQKA